jgi:hypothetical protein
VTSIGLSPPHAKLPRPASVIFFSMTPSSSRSNPTTTFSSHDDLVTTSTSSQQADPSGPIHHPLTTRGRAPHLTSPHRRTATYRHSHCGPHDLYSRRPQILQPYQTITSIVGCHHMYGPDSTTTSVSDAPTSNMILTAMSPSWKGLVRQLLSGDRRTVEFL